MDVADLHEGDGVDDVVGREQALPAGHDGGFGGLWGDGVGCAGKDNSREHHEANAFQAELSRLLQRQAGESRATHEPAGKESDPPGGKEADLGDEESLWLALVEVMKLMKLELGEVLVAKRESDLIMKDAIDPSDEGTHGPEDEHPTELPKREGGVE